MLLWFGFVFNAQRICLSILINWEIFQAHNWMHIFFRNLVVFNVNLAATPHSVSVSFSPCKRTVKLFICCSHCLFTSPNKTCLSDFLMCTEWHYVWLYTHTSKRLSVSVRNVWGIFRLIYKPKAIRTICLLTFFFISTKRQRQSLKSGGKILVKKGLILSVSIPILNALSEYWNDRSILREMLSCRKWTR